MGYVSSTKCTVIVPLSLGTFSRLGLGMGYVSSQSIKSSLSGPGADRKNVISLSKTLPESETRAGWKIKYFRCWLAGKAV